LIPDRPGTTFRPAGCTGPNGTSMRGTLHAVSSLSRRMPSSTMRTTSSYVMSCRTSSRLRCSIGRGASSLVGEGAVGKAIEPRRSLLGAGEEDIRADDSTVRGDAELAVDRGIVLAGE